jgi:hypothetical protein
MKNQGVSITLTVQNQNIKYIYLNNKIDFPTAYVSQPSTKFSGIYLDYIMPLTYPDFSVGSLVYIKRIAINLFGDFAKNSYKTNQNYSIVTLTDSLQSIGFDAIVDLHFLRTWYPIRFKFTQAFIGRDYRAYTNIGLSINLYSNFAGQNL